MLGFFIGVRERRTDVMTSMKLISLGAEMGFDLRRCWRCVQPERCNALHTGRQSTEMAAEAIRQSSHQ
jgi:hypothetical protein